MSICAILVALFTGPELLADDNPVVKEIPTNNLQLPLMVGGKATEPAEIKTAEELAKSPVVGKSEDVIKKHVDFEKEKLLVFAWSGSGGDSVAVSADTKDGKTTMKITFTPGLRADLRRHVKLFVVPRDAQIEK